MLRTPPNCSFDEIAEVFHTLIPNKHLTALGRVAAQWSMLERLIEILICRFSQLKYDTAHIMLCQMQMHSKLDVLMSLLSQKRSKFANQFKPINDYIKDCLIGRRNTVIHGYWFPHYDTDRASIQKFSARGQFLNYSTEVDQKEIDSLAKDITDVITWLCFYAPRRPPLKKRSSVRVRKNRDILRHPDLATRKKRALQPPAS